jgi:serine/threonine-protein kinase
MSENDKQKPPLDQNTTDHPAAQGASKRAPDPQPEPSTSSPKKREKAIVKPDREPSLAPTEWGGKQASTKDEADHPTTPATQAMISEEIHLGAKKAAPQEKKPTDGAFPAEPEAEPTDTLVGQIIADRYDIESRIGEGGMGVVYKATHVGLKKDLAIKVLLPELGALRGVVKRFEREAQSMSRLDHPGVVRVTDFGRTPAGLLFLVMEYVDGTSLGDLLAQQGRLSLARALHLTRQVLLALDHAHNLGVIHRDLKPDNIMVLNRETPQESIKILDFGIAKILEDSGEDGKPLTVAGTVFGTPEYLSPEQAAGEPADHRADIYTMGIILYELITGQRPFEAENRMALIGKHISADPPPLSTVHPVSNLPADIDEIVLRALEKNPADRYTTAMEFYTALSTLPVEKRPVTFWPSPSQPVPPPQLEQIRAGAQATRRRSAGKGKAGKLLSGKRLWGLAGLLLGLAVAVVLGIVFATNDEKTKQRAEKEKTGQPHTTLTDERLKEVEPKLAKKLRTARAHLNAVRPRNALKLLEKLARKYPKEPVVHYLRGRALIMRKHERSGLKSYRRAIELDPRFKKDIRIQEDVFALIRSKSHKDRKAALAFTDEVLAKMAKPILARVFKENENYQTLRSALVIAEKHNLSEVVKKRRFYEMVLRDAPLCSERREAVKQLMLLNDKKVLPALKHALHRKPWYYNHRKRSNKCIADLLRESIERLEGKGGEAGAQKNGDTSQKDEDGKNAK